MSLHQEWIEWSAAGRRRRGYAVRLERAPLPLPTVIVIQEIWGVDGHIRDVTERFAKAGYYAVAPDLYAEDGRRPSEMSEERIEAAKGFLDALPPEAWGDPSKREEAVSRLPEPSRTEIAETLQALFGGIANNMGKYVEILKGLISYLGEFEASRGKPVASVGYCMGGALSALLAAGEPNLAGAVVYYGRLPGEDAAARIRCPMAGFFAELDPAITGQVPAFAGAMRRAGQSWTSQVYPGAKHAFFNDTRGAYDVEAAADAWVRTLAFFHRVLRGKEA
ncbi:MAG: dienelactone hydrolase family protein [Kyrpidia sp.]|nr:dienelactone hydrolase family protein [Kyrpidia sp.]